MLRSYWHFARSNPRFLGFGFLLAFLSSAGQTYFIGVFGPGIRADFNLDAGEWGQIYLLGTLASAVVINWSGSLLDRYDLRLFTVACLLGLVIACLFVSWVSAPILLVVAIFLLRQFGQGLASHTGLTSMARYHDADRGKAIALAAIGFSCGEAILPSLGLFASEFIGWRETYRWVAVFVLLAIAPALWLLKGHAERHEEHERSLRKQADEGRVHYTRAAVLRESRFYLMLPAMIAPSMIVTALFFFPDEIARNRNWSTLWVTGNYWMYSVSTMLVTFSSGVVIDRFSAKKVVPLFLLPLVIALMVLAGSADRWVIWPYMFFMGICSGLYFTGFSALWAELYGAKYLGAIKSLTNAIMVFASALGPALVGTLLDYGTGFALICYLLAGFCLFATVLLVIALSKRS